MSMTGSVVARWLFAAGAVTVAASLCAAAPAMAARAAPTAVTVSVDPAGAGQVGADFAGFSYEKDRVGAGMFDAGDTNLVNLFRLLGPSVLRIGGNLVDIAGWDAKGTGGSATSIAPPDV